MGEIQIRVAPVLLFTGILYQEVAVYKAAKERMTKRWGPILAESEPFDFHHTDYYEGEMGKPLRRVFVAFAELISPGDLARIKRESNEIESELALEGQRRINIDPGYMALSKLVLASTKDYSHRLYLGDHIYGEITLRFSGGDFKPLEWTYPDYREPAAIAFFNHARKLYNERLKLRVNSN